MNCQLSQFHRWNATKHTAHIFADTIPGLVTITTSAVGKVEIFCYFSFVIISLLGTPQLYHLVYWLRYIWRGQAAFLHPEESVRINSLNLGLELRASSLHISEEDFAQRWNTSTLLQRAFSYMAFNSDTQQGSRGSKPQINLHNESI